ncbi:T9SS type A sorting domain-containing protein [Paraflavitalea sp. CAU 1676]|uniref:T9SS type A sorting domain-containing protein n=1 Tax=Paraflavitalea sp. CAU 1676 TaxID=3032598 RepID=UPI0023DBABB9|nr:T9SS type A sorting domain-containing protein [Paraflavitalea sp. CAU 1676]MDF2189909.1 T9SS type A sorting domain-containing protein [Paraflavitalea sp. CAU 1676]
MKHLYTFGTACLLLVCLLLNQRGFAQASVHRKKTVFINNNCGGLWEYLPQGYNPSGTQKYPVIVYLHGDGDRGDGSENDLQKLLGDAIPKNIQEGKFPTTVTSGGRSYSFIVISPQYKQRLVPSEVESILTYVKNNYRVDTDRIYLTGMSLGGGAVWEYAGSSLAAAKKLAGIIPVCGYSQAYSWLADNIGEANLPVWATHNDGDLTVRVTATNLYITLINDGLHPPTPRAKKTIFPSADHDAWTATYDASFKENGRNVYEWALQYSRAEAALPVALSNYKIASSGKEGVSIIWSTTLEQDNQFFSIERSEDGVNFQKIGQVASTNEANGSNYAFKDEHPAIGNNYYRLSQTDVNGKTTLFSLLKATIDVQTGKLVLFPNPATDAITIGFNNPNKDRITVKLLNSQGITVQVNQFNKEAGYWQQRIPTHQLAAGQYFVLVQGTAVEFTQRVMIKK